MILKMPGP
jgi:hypothetical protein